MYKIKAIPTRYNSVKFRSRLEAHWAAFFDLAKIKWEYEPFDLEGWAPDFLLSSTGGSIEILVEIKPTSNFDPKPFLKATRFEKEGISDEDRGGNKYVMCAGRSPLVDVQHEYFKDISAFAFGPDTLFSFYGVDGEIDIAICWGGVWNSLRNLGTSWKATYNYNEEAIPIVSQLWREAGNIVQWHPSK